MTVLDADNAPKKAAQKPAPPRNRRRWWVGVAIVLVPMFIAYGFVCRYLENKLEATVAQKLDAELKVDGLLYLPPYGIRLRGAHLVRQNNVILNLGRVSLKLAESPFGGGPIVIEHFDVANPVVRIIRTKEGLQGGPGFVKEDVKKEPEPKKKFSDFLRLRRFAITHGTIVYDDDTSSYARDVTWRDINLDIHTAQQGPALYTYELTFGSAPFADVSAKGSIDVDSLVLALDNLHLSAHVDPKETESPLPSEVQRILKDYAVAGRLSFDGKGSVPFRELAKTKYDGVVELSGGNVTVPHWKTQFDDASIKLRLAASRPSDAAAAAMQPSMPALNVAVESLRVGSGGALLSVSGGTLAIDPSTRTWTLRELAGKLEAAGSASAQAGAVRDGIEKLKLSGAIDFTAAANGPLKPDSNRRLDESINHELLLYPRGLSIQPEKFPEPLREIGGGMIRVAKGEAVAENLSALYGQDRWLLNGARMPLDGINKCIRIVDVDGSMDFHPPSLEYPKALRATVRALAPSGEFPVSGTFDIDRARPAGQRAQYDLIVSSDTGTFALTPKRIPVTNIRGDAIVRREGPVGIVDIRSFDGDALAGTVSAKVTFITTKPRSYVGTASLREINLAELTKFFELPEKEKHKLVGRGFANVELSGDMEKDTALDSLLGRGRIEAFDGEFFQLPVLNPVANAVAGGTKRDLGTVGEAAILFSVKGRNIHVSQAAFSAPLLGIQGGGDITTDGKLDLNLVAAPLADWRDKLKQTNIPILSDVTGEVAGAIQRTLNAATRGLLYEFRVRGDVKKPEIKTVPSPVLNEARALLFGQMLGKPKDKRLIDSMKDDDVQPKKN
ncbi:MAG: hypothetical protein M3478_05680 [Planctomycetota bacterium]|nr:hypothetical protein [Planctomycetota bacterium]